MIDLEKRRTRRRNMGEEELLLSHLRSSNVNIGLISLSHGVDFGHMNFAQDTLGFSPLVWAYNEEIVRRAPRNKLALRWRHPFLLINSSRSDKTRNTLLIGPPPGERNDASVLRALSQAGIHDYDILIKNRGINIEKSFAFWKNHAERVVTAGERDEGFYQRLHSILADYDHVVSVTVSSATVFAAALGARVRFLPVDIEYFDLADAGEKVNYGGSLRTFVIQASSAKDDLEDFANKLLGAQYSASAEYMISEYQSAIAKLGMEAFAPNGGRSPVDRLRAGVFLIIGDERIASLNWSKLKSRVHGKSALSYIRCSEIDVVLNGKSCTNYLNLIVSKVDENFQPGVGL